MNFRNVGFSLGSVGILEKLYFLKFWNIGKFGNFIKNLNFGTIGKF